MLLAYISLLLLSVGLAVFDWRWRRVPNRVTLLLLVAGPILHFPDTVETWLGCLLLFSSWRLGAMGGGDAKLWMALLWLTPPELTREGLLLLAGVLSVTALLQLAYRGLRKRRLRGIRGPGAWRALPFALWLLVRA